MDDRRALLLDSLEKRNIKRTPDYPHGRSIKWPKVYRGLRRRGMSKEKAARISNAMSNKYRGGSRQPLSRRAGKKPIPEDILDKRPDLRKGQPDGGDLHVNQPLGSKKKRKDEEDEKKRKERKAKKLLVGKRYILDDRFNKHYAPTHDTGTGQEVHSPGGGGGGGDTGGGKKGKDDKKGGDQGQQSQEPEGQGPQDQGPDVGRPTDPGQPTEVNPPANLDAPASGDEALRPTRLADFVGQEALKERLDITMESARIRGAQTPHMLFSGPPGLGKTTLANIMANEMDAQLHVVTGSAIRNAEDLMVKISQLQDGDFLFIDEIHALPTKVQEILYPAMEDFEIDVKLGDDPPFRLKTPEFTVLGATTRAGDLTDPLKQRFGLHGEMEYYEPSQLSELVTRSADKLGVEIDPDAALSLAERSRRTPRVANRLLETARDYALVREGSNRITRSTIDSAMRIARVDNAGLSSDHRDYLSALREMGTAGVDTIAARTGEEKVNIEEAVEPYLLREGFVTKTPRGRIITDKGKNHLDTLDEAYLSKRDPRSILKHGTHDQSTHGNWARGTSARQIKDKTLESGEPKSGDRGSSTYIPTGEEPDTGFVVGTSSRSKHFETQPSVSSIRKYIADNRDLLVKPDYALGTWEAKDGSWWLDTTRVFDTAEEAWEYGPNEEAIFDLDTFSTIYNPSQGD